MDVQQRSAQKRRLVEVVLLILFIVFFALLLIRRHQREKTTLSSMPVAERQVLFGKEYAAFKALCIEGPGDRLESRCRERADFLQQFPECDATCRSQTDLYLSHPAR